MSITVPNRVRTTARAVVAATIMGAAAIGMAGTANAEMYGDPDAAAQYWELQTLDDCVLMSVADVVGQMTGDQPSEVEIVGLAMVTPSTTHPGSIYMPAIDQLAWLGDGMGTMMYDGIKMLDQYDVEAVYTDATYAAEDDSVPATGMDSLAQYLDEGRKVIVSVNSATIWDVAGDTESADHALVVSGIDTSKGIVHLNDSGVKWGQDSQVSIATFEKAWATGDNAMVVTVDTSASAGSSDAR